MQKRETAGKGGGAAATPAKRGRPFGSTANSSGGGASAVAPGDAIAPPALLGPTLQLPTSFAEQNNKRIVLALQSGLKNELTWALNALTLLSFKEKDDMRKDATPLAKISGLLDALLQIVDDWRDIAFDKDRTKPSRVRSLDAGSAVSGFGNNLNVNNQNVSSSLKGISVEWACSAGNGSSNTEKVTQRGIKRRSSEWWFDDEGLFNVDDEGRAEKQLCAVAASNIIRNFSFMPENETVMVQNRHCLESLFKCLEDHHTDEELVTNALETIVNLAPLLDLRIFNSSKPSFIKITEKVAVQAIMGMLNSPNKSWHCASAELLGRLIINPDNEPFLLPNAPQIYKRLVDLLSSPAAEAQSAAVGALYNLAEVNMDCRIKLASERWAVDRLLRIVKAPHPVPEVCKKAAMILESLVSEPQNRNALLAHESAFVEILFSDWKDQTKSQLMDIFARILYELTSRPNKVTTARGIWGV